MPGTSSPSVGSLPGGTSRVRRSLPPPPSGKHPVVTVRRPSLKLVEVPHDLERMTPENDHVPPSKGSFARAPAAQTARNAPDRSTPERLKRARELRISIFPL